MVQGRLRTAALIPIPVFLGGVLLAFFVRRRIVVGIEGLLGEGSPQRGEIGTLGFFYDGVAQSLHLEINPNDKRKTHGRIRSSVF